MRYLTDTSDEWTQRGHGWSSEYFSNPWSYWPCTSKLEIQGISWFICCKEKSLNWKTPEWTQKADTKTFRCFRLTYIRTVGQEKLSTLSRHRQLTVKSVRKSPFLGTEIQCQFFFPMKVFLGPLHFILYILARWKIKLFLFSLPQPTHSKTSEQAVKNDRKKSVWCHRTMKSIFIGVL